MSDPWRAPDPDRAPSREDWSPWAPPGGSVEPSRPWWDVAQAAVREHRLPFLAATAGTLLLGAPLGLLWVAAAPRIGVVETAEGLALTSPEGSSFFAVEGWFALLSVLAGVVTAVVAWRALRRRGPSVPLGLVTGALLGARVAREVGGRVVVDERVHRFCTVRGAGCLIYDGTPHVRATAALLVWALTAAAVHLLLVAILDRDPASPRASGWPWPAAAGAAEEPEDPARQATPARPW